MLALIYLQAWSVLLCMHIYINDAAGLHTAYGVKGCLLNTVCVIIVMHVVMWFYANTPESSDSEPKQEPRTNNATSGEEHFESTGGDSPPAKQTPITSTSTPV